MKPSPFAYRAPRSLEETLDLLAEHGPDEARLLAGGQSLMPMLALRLARPSMLIDLGHVEELTTIAADEDGVSIGSMVRERAAERSAPVLSSAPLLVAALPFIGHPAIRSRGTIGGSISHADPAAELPAVALSLDAEMVAASRDRGERTIPAAEFFRGYFMTALESDEALVRIRLRSPAPGTGVAVEEMARRHGDFAVVGVACSLTVLGGAIEDARLALFGVGSEPVRAAAAEKVLRGAEPGMDAFSAAAESAVADLSPPADLHGSAGYRRHVAGVIVKRALARAAERAKGNA